MFPPPAATAIHRPQRRRHRLLAAAIASAIALTANPQHKTNTRKGNSRPCTHGKQQERLSGMKKPVVDAVDSVLSKYLNAPRQTNDPKFNATKVLKHHGLTPSQKGTIILILGKDADGAEHEIACKNFKEVHRRLTHAFRNHQKS